VYRELERGLAPRQPSDCIIRAQTEALVSRGSVAECRAVTYQGRQCPFSQTSVTQAPDSSQIPLAPHRAAQAWAHHLWLGFQQPGTPLTPAALRKLVKHIYCPLQALWDRTLLMAVSHSRHTAWLQNILIQKETSHSLSSYSHTCLSVATSNY
jgi:hypothetical protein